MRSICTAFFLWSFVLSYGQDIVGLSTRWDDSFAEWIIYGEYEGEEGEIVMKYPMREDWSQWNFSFGEINGTIQVKWKGDANLWELRGANEIVTIRTVWKDDWRQWEVKNGDVRIDVKSKWGNIFEEWTTTNSQHGEMKIYTSWEGDLRDWVIEDHLKEEVSLPTKLALAFIPLFHSTPKF